MLFTFVGFGGASLLISFGRVIKNIFTELYKDYTQNREFKLSDYDKLVTYVRFNKSGGGLQRSNTKIKIDKEIKETIKNINKII